MSRYCSERGQVVPLVAVAVVVAAGIASVIVTVGGVLADRATARTAADAAALVAAVDTDDAARAVAAANHAELVAVHRDGNQVEVEVRVGRAWARARAEVGPARTSDTAARRAGDSIP